MPNDSEQRANDPLPSFEAASSRRKLGIGLLALAASGLVASAAEALPRRFRHELHRANRILRRFGLRVTGSEGRHDVLTVSALPLRNTEYDFVVNERARTGELEPCVKTSFFNEVSEFTKFEVLRGAPATVARTTIDGPQTTFEHFDPEKNLIDPCWKAEVIDDGRVDATTVTVIDRAIDFSVVVGDRVWQLVGGALVERR